MLDLETLRYVNSFPTAAECKWALDRARQAAETASVQAELPCEPQDRALAYEPPGGLENQY